MTTPDAAATPAVIVRRLRYEFPGGTVALTDVSFSAAKGERSPHATASSARGVARIDLGA